MSYVSVNVEPTTTHSTDGLFSDDASSDTSLVLALFTLSPILLMVRAAAPFDSTSCTRANQTCN